MTRPSSLFRGRGAKQGPGVSSTVWHLHISKRCSFAGRKRHQLTERSTGTVLLGCHQVNHEGHLEATAVPVTWGRWSCRGPVSLQRLLPRRGRRTGDAGLQRRRIPLAGTALGTGIARSKARPPAGHLGPSRPDGNRLLCMGRP